MAFIATIAIFLVYWSRQAVPPSDWGQNLQLVAFACIDASPYLGFGALSFWARRSTSSAIVVLAVTIVSAALGTWLIADVLLIRVDAFAAFMLIIVPLGQWFIVAMLAVAAAISKGVTSAMGPKHSAPASDGSQTGTDAR